MRRSHGRERKRRPRAASRRAAVAAQAAPRDRGDARPSSRAQPYQPPRPAERVRAARWHQPRPSPVTYRRAHRRANRRNSPEVRVRNAGENTKNRIAPAGIVAPSILAEYEDCLHVGGAGLIRQLRHPIDRLAQSGRAAGDPDGSTCRTAPRRRLGQILTRAGRTSRALVRPGSGRKSRSGSAVRSPGRGFRRCPSVRCGCCDAHQT